jgi:Putative adhesin
MRTILTVTLLAALATPAAAQDDRPDAAVRIRKAVAKAYPERTADSDRERFVEQRRESREQVERTTRTLRVGANGELQLSNVAGDITITGGGGNDVSVEIVKTARASDDAEARDMLQLVQVEVIERGGRAEVRARYPQGEESRRNNRRNINVQVAFNVTAPASVRIRATSISGSITTKDVRGEVFAESVSGTVRVINGGRVGSAKSISGNVEILDTDLDGSFNASSASGSVVLRRVKGRQLTLGSISGNVELEDVDCQQVEAQSVSGNVRFGGPIAKGGRYELNSHSGNVAVSLGGSTGFEVEATSFSGSIKSDFSFGSNGEQSRWRRSVRGVHGDGSAMIELTTFSGSIVIARR